MTTPHASRHASAPTERFVEVPGGAVFTRSVGDGPPVVVVHGGPGIVDHSYLLPELDRLADVCRLVYYDQRGHGRSRGDPRPDEITVDRFLEDLELVCDALGLDSVTLLGHSWGTYLVMRFAIQRPGRVHRVVLMNTVPPSSVDQERYLAYRGALTAPLADTLTALRSSPAFAEGDPDLAADHLRLLMSVGIKRPADVERLNLRFTRENVLRGRMIFQRLDEEAFAGPFDLLPSLAGVTVPALVLHGDHDFVPLSAAERVAGALPDARLVVIPDCGHCAYLEAMDTVYAEVARFLRG